MKCLVVGLLLFTVSAVASEYSGQVLFNGLPVPGVTVIARHDAIRRVTTTNEAGLYTFADLSDGVWKIETEMTGFAAQSRQVTVSANTPREKWELTLLPVDQVKAAVQTT